MLSWDLPSLYGQEKSGKHKNVVNMFIAPFILIGEYSLNILKCHLRTTESLHDPNLFFKKKQYL